MYMKRVFLLFAIFFTTITVVNAQDASQKIELKKVFGGHVFMQNGESLTHNQVADLMKNNNEALALMKSAKSNRTWSTVLGVAGGGLIGYPIGASIGGGNAKWELAAVGAGLILVAIPIANGYNKKTRKAVELYNNGLTSSAYQFKPIFHLNLKGNSVGLTMNF